MKIKTESDSGGWIRLYRSVFVHEFADEPWDRMSAWMYLVSIAAYKPYDAVYRRHTYHLQRGQTAIVMSDLATKAQWSKWKVKRFFDLLVKRDMIEVKSDSICCVLTILNYEKYQSENAVAPATATATPIATATATANDSPILTIEGLPATAVATASATAAATQNKKSLIKVQGQVLKDCVEEEKTDAPLFVNSDFLIPEETETKPDKAIQATTSVPYLLALWFYQSRNIPAQPTPADMHYAKLLLQFYPESVIKKGIEWRLASDTDGYWQSHITIAAVYRQFGNWMAESSVKAISLRQWVEKNPDMNFERFTDPLARADGFMRAFNEAKRNRLVYFEDADYAMYKKAIRIKTSESKAETKEVMDGRNR